MRIRDRNYPGDYHGVLDYLGTVRIVDGYDTHDPIAAAIDYDHDDDNDEYYVSGVSRSSKRLSLGS